MLRRTLFALLGLSLGLTGCRSSGLDYPMGRVGADPLRDVTTLGWLAGSWAEEGKGFRWEEHWTAPAGGTMVGMARMVQDGATAFTEALRIEQRQDGIVYVATPSNQPTTEFLLVEHTGWQAVFSNPAHKTPSTIGYRLQPDGSLMAWIENEVDGQIQREFFPKTRAALP